jgi:POT family proton-dependent oligopeptide transporter
MPPGLPHIVANEAAERFSYYGMKAILTVFMTRYLVDASGASDVLSDADAKGVYHLFSAATYLFPLLGALLSDILWGKYRTILGLSVAYCLGHGALALGDTALGRLTLEPRQWLGLGLLLLALGAGGLKPCVSAHVGDQFGARNAHLLPRAFGWFYLAINVGATASFLLTPLLLARWGAALAFGVPGLVMALALGVFWLGRRRFVHVPPAGWRRFRDALVGGGSWRALLHLVGVYVLIAPFWALFDQTGSSWVLQAESMDRRLFGIEWLASQLGALNPILVLVLVPLATYVVYPWLGRFVTVTAPRKLGVGLFLAALAFAIVAVAQSHIDAGGRPSVAWQLAAYFVLTSAEVLVSITALELTYHQAPRELKSLVMALYLASMALGNAFTSAVNFLQGPTGAVRLEGAAYFWFFAGVMAVTGLAYIPWAARLRERVVLQG